MEPQRDVFAPLNGMRGVAAIAVVLYHAQPFFGPNLAPRGYLAVDLFFVLSGFVIAHAYRRRFANGLTAPKFFWQRLKRFWPLYMLGTVLTVGWVSLELVVSPPAILTPVQLALAAVAGALFLPAPFTGDLYPLNVPAWSLLWELVINFIFALMWRRTATLMLFAMACWVGLYVLIGAGKMDQGSADPVTGFLRAGFSFPAGVVIYRWREILRRVQVIPPLVVMAAVATLFVVPLADMLVVTFLFPLAIILLARCEDNRAYAMLGAMSFPLYATHYPIVMVGLGLSHRLLPNHAIGVAVVAVAIGFAFMADRLDVWLRVTQAQSGADVNVRGRRQSAAAGGHAKHIMPVRR